MKYKVGDKVWLRKPKNWYEKCGDMDWLEKFDTKVIIDDINFFTNEFSVKDETWTYVYKLSDIDHEKTKKINQEPKLKDGNSISYKQSEKRRIFKEITDNMLQLYKDKNEDYGDSFKKVREEYPHAIIIRLMDKLGRLKSLYKGEVNIKDEGIENVLIDMANYCVMEMVERRIENDSK